MAFPALGIRTRVTLMTFIVCLAAMAAVVALSAYASQASVKEILGRSLDERLDAAQMEVASGDVGEAVDHSGIDLLQAVDSQGRVIASTPNVQGMQAIGAEGDRYEVDDLELDELPETDSGSGGTGEAAVHFVEASSVLATPGPFLVMRRTVDSPEGPVTLVALTSLHLALETAEGTARVLAGLLLVLLAFAVAFTWKMTGRMLRPVERMRREVEAVSTHDLSARITPPESDPDLSALARTFNRLLERIQDSVDEQKRFVSDASHELKSPIASTGLMLETLRRHPETVDEAEVLDDLAAENSRLAGIVDDLLTLARHDERRLLPQKAPVDYCDLLYEEAAALRQRTTAVVDDAGVQPVVGLADTSMLSHAVRNLLDNAARYAATTVWVTCREREGMVTITVSDDGPGIPEEDRERVFRRFERLETSRSRKDGGTGLGLPVARSIVERHGGSLRFADSEHGGVTAVIELPIG